MRTIRIDVTANHKLIRTKVLEVLASHTSKMDAIEQLALMAHLVGQLTALQDQRKYGPADVMGLVADNIEAGNREMVAELREGKAAGTA